MQKNNKRMNFIKTIKEFSLKNTIYRLCWKHFNKPEVVFFAGNPLEYVMFKDIHKFLPEVKIITNSTFAERKFKLNQ